MVLLNRLIKYSGISGFVAFAAALYTGISGSSFAVHRLSAIAGVCLMSVHGGLILYRGWKIKKQTQIRQASLGLHGEK